MKRSEMIKHVQDAVYVSTHEDLLMSKEEAALLLSILEKKGMKPPELKSIHRQALLDAYLYPDFNQWEEDIKKDKAVMFNFKKRLYIARKGKTRGKR